MHEVASTVRIRHHLEPGDLGMVVHLHGRLYAREYGLDHRTFEPYVAKPLADVVLNGHGRLWIAEDADRTLGSIAIVDVEDGVGQLRWFLLVPEARGCGLGQRLLKQALDYCGERRFKNVFLWSFADLTAALKLYERAGFQITQQETDFVWGGRRTQVRMDLTLAPPLDPPLDPPVG
jgi:GNAT superfamily N-acetyltransferase